MCPDRGEEERSKCRAERGRSRRHDSPDQRGHGRMMRIFIWWKHKALAQQPLIAEASVKCLFNKIGSLSGAVVSSPLSYHIEREVSDT